LRTAGLSSSHDRINYQDAVYAPYATAFAEHNLPSGYPAINDLSHGSGRSAFPALKDQPTDYYPETDDLSFLARAENGVPSSLSAQPATSHQDYKSIISAAALSGTPLTVQTDDLETSDPFIATANVPQSSIVPRAPPPSALEPTPYSPSQPIPSDSRQAPLQPTREEASHDFVTSANTPTQPSHHQTQTTIAMPTPKRIARSPTPPSAPSTPRTPKPFFRASTPTGAPQRTVSPTSLGRGHYASMSMNRPGMGFRISSSNGFGQAGGTPPRWGTPTGTSSALIMDQSDLESVDGDTTTEDGEETETETEDGLE
jgi:hypothetical protein